MVKRLIPLVCLLLIVPLAWPVRVRAQDAPTSDCDETCKQAWQNFGQDIINALQNQGAQDQSAPITNGSLIPAGTNPQQPPTSQVQPQPGSPEYNNQIKVSCDQICLAQTGHACDSNGNCQHNNYSTNQTTTPYYCPDGRMCGGTCCLSSSTCTTDGICKPPDPGIFASMNPNPNTCNGGTACPANYKCSSDGTTCTPNNAFVCPSGKFCGPGATCITTGAGDSCVYLNNQPTCGQNGFLCSSNNQSTGQTNDPTTNSSGNSGKPPFEPLTNNPDNKPVDLCVNHPEAVIGKECKTVCADGTLIPGGSETCVNRTSYCDRSDGSDPCGSHTPTNGCTPSTDTSLFDKPTCAIPCQTNDGWPGHYGGHVYCQYQPGGVNQTVCGKETGCMRDNPPVGSSAGGGFNGTQCPPGKAPSQAIKNAGVVNFDPQTGCVPL